MNTIRAVLLLGGLPALLAIEGAAASPSSGIHLKHRRESAAGVTLLGGPLCSTVTSPVEHQCEDPFQGSLGGQWLMFYAGDYMTLVGKGYVRLRWEWAWFNYPRVGQFDMPTFTDQTGTFLQVANAEYPADVLGLTPSLEYGQTHLGAVLFTPPSTHNFAYDTFPAGVPMQWQNQYYYLDGSITIHENENFADYNLALSPVSYDQMLGDVSTPVLANALATRPGVSLDPPAKKPAPTAPANLSAAVTATNVALSWTACGGAADGTMVEYSDGALFSDGVTLMYKLGATLVGKPHDWTIGRLAPGNGYSLRVKCYNAAGDSPYSNVVQVAIPAAGRVPKGWVAADIGIDPQAEVTDPSFGYPGTLSVGSKIFQVGGSGTDIWNTADHFRFVYMPVTGDVTITARVVDNEYTNTYAKAGVMIRETLDPSATEVTGEVTPGAGIQLQARYTTGGGTSGSVGGADRAPYWVRLQRSGNVITGSFSADGKSWSVLGAPQVTMAASVYAGLAVTAHQTFGVLPPLTPYNDFNGLDTAGFDHVTISTP